MFKIEQKFLKKLHTKLNEANDNIFDSVSGEFVSNSPDLIPSINHLEEIVSGMFWASTQMEEGRLLRFKVMYSKPSKSSDLGLDFEAPIPWEAEEIRKLASAVTPPDGRLCVYPDSNEGNLFIQGMHSKTREKDPVSVVFEIIEPARVIIQFPATKKIAEIRGQVSGFIDEIWNEAGSELLSLSPIRQIERKTKSTKLFFLHRTMTQEILSRMRLLRHGGSLLFVTETTSLDRSIENPKYKCGKGFNAIQSLENSVLRSLDKESISNTPLPPDFAEIKALNTSQNKLKISDSARTVAYLTAVDGATILSSKFEVIAFGAKIKEPQHKGEEQRVTVIFPLEDKEPITPLLTDEFRGKRHFSVARFVSNTPDSIGFAVSQDGGITGFLNKDNQLTAYKGLELLL